MPELSNINVVREILSRHGFHFFQKPWDKILLLTPMFARTLRRKAALIKRCAPLK